MQYIMKLWESLPQVLSSPRHKKFRNILNHTLGDFHWLLNLDTKRQLTELLSLSLQEVRRLHQGRIVLYLPYFLTSFHKHLIPVTLRDSGEG